MLAGYLSKFAEGLPAGNDLQYVEPYCGGAGAALGLLAWGRVKTVYLNDGDIRIFSVWNAMLNENKRFLEELKNTPINLDVWHRCREIVASRAQEYSFELGFATFFINRTSRAGIVIGSGPIGGYQQSGAWKLDARFYRDTMLKRVSWIGENSHSIKISNDDGLAFLKASVEILEEERTFYLIDPPYVQAGGRLYLDTMTEEKHRRLAEFLTSSDKCKNWVLTYDDHPLIRELYSEREISRLQLQYSLGRTRQEAELLVV